MKKAVFAFAVLLVAAGFVFVPSLLAGNGGSGGPGGMGAPGSAGPEGGAPAFSVRTGTAEVRSLEAYLELNGNVVSREQVSVLPDIGGKIASIKVAPGSRVRRGDLLAEIDPSHPGTVYSLSPVYAPVSGTVISVPGTVGSTVSTATAIMTIASGGDIEIEVLVPERETGQLRTGLRAELRLEAFPGETFAAYIAELSPVVDPVSRTKKAVLRFAANDGRINAGMFARVKLSTRTYENVVAVDSAAVIENRGVKAVYVVNSGLLSGGAQNPGGTRAELREVSLGAAVDGLVEITDGLSAGETVVVQGQQFLSDGAQVRVIARN